MLFTPVSKEYRTTLMVPLKELAPVFHGTRERLVELAQEEFAAEGIDSKACQVETWLEMRYQGQSYELDVPLENDNLALIEAGFEAVHERAYGFVMDRELRELEVVNLAIRMTHKTPVPTFHTDTHMIPHEAEATTHLRLYDHGWQACPLYLRDTLKPGARFSSPALLMESYTTTYIPNGFLVRVDAYRSLVITREGDDHAA
jgi:N-methylhydantoinase A